MKKEPVYNIRDKVYYNLPDGEVGMIIDCIYSLRYARWNYIVSFGIHREVECYEDELTITKRF